MCELKSPLEKLFGKLNHRSCNYFSWEYSQKDAEGTEVVMPVEILTVKKDSGDERVDVIYFCIAPTLVLYTGKDRESMKKTLADLRIPKHSHQNLGENIFHLFEGNIKDQPEENVSLQREIRPGAEHKLEYVLRKLIRVYSGGKIDGYFYYNPRAATTMPQQS